MASEAVQQQHNPQHHQRPEIIVRKKCIYVGLFVLVGIIYSTVQIVYLSRVSKTLFTAGGTSTVRTRSDGNITNNYKNDDFALASHQSFGFFHDITTEQWKLHQIIMQNYNKHLYPLQPLTQLPNGVTAWYQEVC